MSDQLRGVTGLVTATLLQPDHGPVAEAKVLAPRRPSVLKPPTEANLRRARTAHLDQATRAAGLNGGANSIRAL